MKDGGVVACVVVFFFLILVLCAGTGWSNNRTYNQCKKSYRQSPTWHSNVYCGNNKQCHGNTNGCVVRLCGTPPVQCGNPKCEDEHGNKNAPQLIT